MGSYFSSNDVLFHPSTTEQWGLVVNEAMAAGLVIIGSDRTGSIKELVEDGVNGFTFDPHTIHSITSAVKNFHSCSIVQKKEIRLRGIDTIKSFDLDRFCGGLKELIND